MTELERRLREGTGADDAMIARELDVAATDEAGFGRALVTALARDPVLGPERAWSVGGELARPRAEGSFLDRLEASSAEGGRGIDRLDDLSTLLAVLRGGSLRQRRAAIARLGEIGGSQPHEERLRIDEALAALRDEDLALDALRARLRIGVGDVADLGGEDEHAQGLLATLDTDIGRYYEGELEHDPLTVLDAESRARIGSRLRMASDRAVGHLAALLEGGGDELRESRVAWLAAIRSAGDPRLSPTLGALLDARERHVALEAARALGRIDTPVARSLLSAAFRRTGTPADRALLGGMLGLHGDTSVLGELRETMRAEDPRARLAAVEAIGPIGTSEDFEPLASLLGTGSLSLDRAVVRALGRLGDARAVRLLRGLRDTDRGPTLSTEIAEALRTVRAQMELRGERDVPEGPIAPVITRVASPWWARAIAQLHVALAAFLARIGMQARAVRRLDRAIARARDLAFPWVAKGRLFESRGSSAEALVVFRRAIELDRGFVERTPLAVRSVARAFLERAEAMSREGRRDVALGLLDEALSLDLRRVPPSLRQALRREREKLTREEVA